jgi:hypothetical protein
MTKLGELMFQQTYSLDRLLATPSRPHNYGLARRVMHAKPRATAAGSAATAPDEQIKLARVDDVPDALLANPQPTTTAPADEASPVMSRLEALPPELVDAILAAIVSHSDLFALGCALPRLWPYVSRHVEEGLSDAQARRVGGDAHRHCQRRVAVGRGPARPRAQLSRRAC